LTKLDGPAWHSAAWTEDFVDIEEAHRPRPRANPRQNVWTSILLCRRQVGGPRVGTLTNHDSVVFNDPDWRVSSIRTEFP
jgi:hypothetical protein